MSNHSTQQMRVWLSENGFTPGARGRFSKEMIAAFDAAHPAGGYVPKAERVEVEVTVEDDTDRLAEAVANVSDGDPIRITLNEKTYEVEARLSGGSLWVGDGEWNRINLSSAKGWINPELSELVVL